MNKIHDISFLELVPPSIKEDATIASSALVLDDLLKKTVLSIPNLLIYSRLGGHDANTMLAPLARIIHARGGLKPLSLAELEQLAWQIHVDFRELAKTNEELTQMIRNSIAWHRIKGTPQSILNALSLFGFFVRIEEGGMHWAHYQFSFGESVVNVGELQNIIQIANEMAPVRNKLYRIYNDEYDIRPFMFSKSKLSGAFYSYFSGTTIGDDDLIISLGRKQSAESEKYAPKDAYAGFFRHSYRSFLCVYMDAFKWSYSKISDKYPVRSGFYITRESK